MNSGSAASIDGGLSANWLPTGVWQGLRSGSYGGGLHDQGVGGYYWSSTANFDLAGRVYYLGFYGSFVDLGYGNKYVGYAVRCAI